MRNLYNLSIIIWISILYLNFRLWRLILVSKERNNGASNLTENYFEKSGEIPLLLLYNDIIWHFRNWFNVDSIIHECKGLTIILHMSMFATWPTLLTGLRLNKQIKWYIIHISCSATTEPHSRKSHSKTDFSIHVTFVAQNQVSKYYTNITKKIWK